MSFLFTCEKKNLKKSFLFSHARREIEKKFFPRNARCEIPHPFPSLRGHPALYKSFHQIKLRFRIATQKKKLRMKKFFLRKKARMTSNDNILMLFRRRRHLTLRNQIIKKISILLLISLLCSLSREQRRSFEFDANFAFDV